MNTLVRNFYVALGRVMHRSDVRVVEFNNVGPQPNKNVPLSDEVRAFFSFVGATYFSFELLNDRGPSYGGCSLRAPSSKGWWDASRVPATTWPWRGGESFGFPGEEVAIVQGGDEGGVLIRKNGGFASFDSDGVSTPLGDDLSWLQAGVRSLFAGEWDAPKGANQADADQLASEVPLRTYVDAKVTKVEELDSAAARRCRLGALPEFNFRFAMEALNIDATYDNLTPEERGAILADAIKDPKAFDAKTRKAIIPFGKSTVGAFADLFVLKDSPPLTRCTAEVTINIANPEQYFWKTAMVVRLLLDAGVTFVEVDADAVRYVPENLIGSDPKRRVVDEVGKISALVPTVTAVKSDDSSKVVLEFTLADDVQHNLEVGQTWSSSAIEPLTVPS